MYAFPEDWDKSKMPTKKKRKHDRTATASTVPPNTSTVSTSSHSTNTNTASTTSASSSLPSFSSLPPCIAEIMKAIHDSQQVAATPAELDLDVILSKTSLHSILSDLFHRDQIQDSVQVPIVSKIYEESYMREPHENERSCSNSSLCECNFIDPDNPFVGVEFLVPGETVLPPTPHTCVLCARKLTQKLFYDIVFTGREYKGCIQRYGNICNVPGEYARECCLICPPHISLHCLPLPMMSHQRNKYQVYISNGIRTLRQVRVSYEDFHNPLTKE